MFGICLQDMTAKPQIINRRRIVITAIVGCLVVGLIILGIVLLSGQSGSKNATSLAHTQQRRTAGVGLEQILDGSFNPNRFNGTFVSGMKKLANQSAQLYFENNTIILKLLLIFLDEPPE